MLVGDRLFHKSARNLCVGWPGCWNTPLVHSPLDICLDLFLWNRSVPKVALDEV